ncbi:AAA family ATPase [Patescibacteria group bacterium]|nr:AAA family ATPase [Patescibacteria group bacterium]MBU4580309.1 AAA family ATPase [Patescibacteria group bacterium]
MYKRLQQFRGLGSESCFLWGPRQSGKSTLLKTFFPSSPYYDLLLSDEFERLNRKPSFLREELLANHPVVPVIIDEVQKIPQLLDEIQWLIVNRNIQFILCGSSARKLKRGSGNLLGGRALRYELFPLVSAEIPQFDLMRALNHGCLPRHYQSDHPELLGRSYVGDYLKEEIAAEALTRNVPAFARFLEAASFSNGEVVNFINIARECGVSGPTAKEYFQILVDTLLARFVPPFQKKPKRRVIQAPKFYLFDVGIANALLKRGTIFAGSEIFGRAFEHFILQEIIAHSHYSGLEYPVSYWRTASGFEVDFILGDRDVALEVKGVSEVHSQHLRSINAFREEYKPKHAIIVSLDAKPRNVNGLTIMPWKKFLGDLWAGLIIN